jgi:hypothetical protein
MTPKSTKVQAQPAAGTCNGDGHLDPEAMKVDVSVPPVWAGDEEVDYQKLRAPAFVLSPVKKPVTKGKAVSWNLHTQEFVRRYECPESAIPYAVVLEKMNRGSTLIIPETPQEVLAPHTTYANFELVINHDNELIFVTVPFSDRFGNTNEYWTSKREILAESTTRWVKLLADQSARKYVPDYPRVPLDDPEWPEEINWGALFSVAFQGHILHHGHRAMRGLIGGTR